MPSKKQDRPNVGYEAANQHDDPTTVLPADEMDKSNRSFWKKCAFYSCLVGFGFIVLGIVFAFIMEPLVESRIRANLPLVEGSKAFNGWKDPPVTPLLFLRLFNLTNEKEFLSGKNRIHYPDGSAFLKICFRRSETKAGRIGSLRLPRQDDQRTYQVSFAKRRRL